MAFEAQLARLGDLGQPLAHSELKQLAGLDPASLKAFWQSWVQFPAERRLELMLALNALGEDNVDLDFHPVLRACLSDTDAQVRAAAITGLWEDESERTLERLVTLVDDEAGEVRAAAMVALAPFACRAELGELTATNAQRLFTTLLSVATDPEQPFEVRRRAIEALGYFANAPEAQAMIGRAYAHTESPMRESAVLAMGRSMRPTWFPYIERELKSSVAALRYEAARAVGELGEDGRPLLPGLVRLLEDDDTEVALAAIWSLGQVGGAGARRILERLARSKDATRRQSATDALAEVLTDEL